MKKNAIPVLIVVGLILVIAACVGLSVLIRKYTPSKEHMTLEDYFKTGGEDSIAVVLNHERITDEETVCARKIGDSVYLDYGFVHDNINRRFYWDENENILLYTTASDVISADADSTQYLVGKTLTDFDKIIVKADADTAWVEISFVQQYSDFAYTYYEEPDRLILTTEWGEVHSIDTKRATALRVRGGIKSDILADLEKGTTLTLLKEDENWDRVATEDGIVGYVRRKYLHNEQTDTLTSDFTPETFSHQSRENTICMAWHQVTASAANAEIASVLASTKGVNVISPTWFYLNDDEGHLADLASNDYVNYCHSQKVEVWALFSNLENADADTSYVLTHTSVRKTLVNEIVSAAIQYDLDGVNLDFEAIKPEVGDAYIQFVRELSIKLRNNDIVLSVDNYVPTDYTAFYQRDEQANFADYVVIMGYDEHTNVSEQEGSVASIDWVREGVENTLAEVPAGQTILGMPFYTRIWTLTGDTESDSENADYTFTSKAYGMKAAWSIVESHQADTIWLEECGQYFASYPEGSDICEVWLENAESTEERLKVMKEHSLAGASFWKLGFETEDVWDTIVKYMN